MKKQMFRMLCVVLALALLAPNVFAATPPPEVPLADEATVTRVKNEIAAGEITDMEDVFLVAYQHLGADLEEEGMTAYINEDGTLGFTQIISTTNSNARSGGMVEEEYAVTSLLLIDNNGEIMEITQDYNYEYDSFSSSGGLDDVMVYAVHTAHIVKRYINMIDDKIQLRQIVTTLSYGTNAFYASQLKQSYLIYSDMNTYEESGERTLYTLSAGTYTYNTGSYGWYDPIMGTPGGYISTVSEVLVANTGKGFAIVVKIPLMSDEDLYN